MALQLAEKLARTAQPRVGRQILAQRFSAGNAAKLDPSLGRDDICLRGLQSARDLPLSLPLNPNSDRAGLRAAYCAPHFCTSDVK